jgi:hypothetical protein
MTTMTNFNATEFCSRKLWELISSENKSASESELEAAVKELAMRRHYLTELEQIGVFEKHGN